MPDADLVLTDPPYGISWRRGANPKKSSKAHKGIQNDSDTTCRDHVLKILKGVPAIVFGSFYAPFPIDIKQILVWKKPAGSGVVGSVTGFRRDLEPVFLLGNWPIRKIEFSSLLDVSNRAISAVVSETGHPHTKPLALIIWLISITPRAHLILDPFMGSGTTLRAAKDLGRKAIGIEIEERYCEIAAKRMAQETLGFGGESNFSAPAYFDSPLNLESA